MKINNILLALILVAVVSVVSSEAQNVSMSLVPSGKQDTTVVTFQAPSDRQFVIFEAVLPARTTEECFAATDFSSAVPVGPERVSMIYDPATARFYLKNTNTTGSVESCRVLLVRSSVNTSDLNVFRARFGSTSALAETEDIKEPEEMNAAAQRSMVTSIKVTFDSPVIQ